MSTASEHGRTVLAAIIPDGGDLLEKALRHLAPEHFVDPVCRNLWVMLERYHGATGKVLRRPALDDLLASTRADAGKIALHLEVYDLLAAQQADDADFTWSLNQVRDLAADRATGEALTQAMEILTRGAQDERGNELKGHTDARTHLLGQFSRIDRELAMQEAPEGDIRVEGDEFLAAYATGEAALRQGRAPGINFGIPMLDAKLNGLQPGELCLVVAYTNDGKTHLCVQLAHHAAVMQGRNVVFFTTETVRDTVRRRIVTRHSMMEHFGITGGLNSRDIKNHSLTSDQKDQLQTVVRDLSANPAYGKLWIAQVPWGATVGLLESRLARLQRMFPVDLVIMDSLYLLEPERKRGSMREELTGILKDSARLGTTFNDGFGVPIVSPWQVSRAARQEAERTGGYHSSALSETAEASNSAHIIVSLLAPMDNDNRTTTLKMQVMKNRDGEKANPFDVPVDYATSAFALGQRATAPAMEDVFGAGLLGAL